MAISKNKQDELLRLYQGAKVYDRSLQSRNLNPTPSINLGGYSKTNNVAQNTVKLYQGASAYDGGESKNPTVATAQKQQDAYSSWASMYGIQVDGNENDMGYLQAALNSGAISGDEFSQGIVYLNDRNQRALAERTKNATVAYAEADATRAAAADDAVMQRLAAYRQVYDSQQGLDGYIGATEDGDIALRNLALQAQQNRDGKKTTSVEDALAAYRQDNMEIDQNTSDELTALAGEVEEKRAYEYTEMTDNALAFVENAIENVDGVDLLKNEKLQNVFDYIDGFNTSDENKAKAKDYISRYYSAQIENGKKTDIGDETSENSFKISGTTIKHLQNSLGNTNDFDLTIDGTKYECVTGKKIKDSATIEKLNKLATGSAHGLPNDDQLVIYNGALYVCNNYKDKSRNWYPVKGDNGQDIVTVINALYGHKSE